MIIFGQRPRRLAGIAVAPNKENAPKMTQEPINLAGLTDRQRLYAEFWRPILEHMNREYGWKRNTVNTRAHFDAKTGLGNGFGPFGRTMRFTGDGKAQVVLNIDKPKSKAWNKTVFDLLKEDENREGIEGAVGGCDWLWYRLDRANVCRIAISRDGEITDSQESLDEIRRWMVKHFVEFPAIFRPHLDRALAGVERR